MYVCICNAITEKQLEEAQKTAKSFREICKKLGLGTDCGACIQDAIQTINKTQRSEKKSE
jgi:bacterioferritin-associated ferredoxin